MSGLAGRTVLVLGASRGIGRNVAQAASRAGARLVLASRDLAALEALANELGGGAVAFAVDAARYAAMAGLAQAVAERVGPLDALVINPGRILGAGPVVETAREVFDDAFALNAGGVFNALRTLAPQVRDGGSIVVNSARSGVAGMPGIGVYSAAKAAAIMLARVAARELGVRGVRVNAIAPGYIATDAWMAKLGDRAGELAATVPLRRLGTGEEVAEVVVWLLSDASRYVTGAVIPIDGGMSA